MLVLACGGNPWQTVLWTGTNGPMRPWGRLPDLQVCGSRTRKEEKFCVRFSRKLRESVTVISFYKFLWFLMIFFRLFCNTAVVLYIFSLEILREKLARGRPKLVSSRIPYVLPLCCDSFSSLSLENMRRSHRQGFHEDDFRFHNRNVISCCR